MYFVQKESTGKKKNTLITREALQFATAPTIDDSQRLKKIGNNPFVIYWLILIRGKNLNFGQLLKYISVDKF